MTDTRFFEWRERSCIITGVLSNLSYWDICILCGIALLVISIGFEARRKRYTKLRPLYKTRKRNQNNENLYSRIHGKWYNLSGFEHPGGPVALSLAKGRDATAMFESHHYFISRKKLMKILAKFEVPESTCMTLSTLDKRDDGSPYNWCGVDADGFTSELRAFVNEHFLSIAKERGMSKVDASKATAERWMIVCVLLGLFFGSIPSFVKGNWFFLILTPVLAWVSVVNYWHDAMHFSLSSNWRINATLPYLLPLISSPSMWYHHHVIGHHAYTNISHKDPDLAHAPQLMREHKSIRWRASHSNQALISHILLVWSIAVGVGLQLLNDTRAMTKLSYNNVCAIDKLTKPRLFVHAGGRIMYMLITFIWPYFVFPLWKAIIWATVPNAIFSICFMLNTQINHLVGPCAHAFDSNFFKHQVKTAQNFGRASKFCFYFSGGLNYQIEHHLFPTINHCHLPALSNGVKKICEKHGVPYHHASGYRDAIAEHFAHTADMAIQPQ